MSLRRQRAFSFIASGVSRRCLRRYPRFTTDLRLHHQLTLVAQRIFHEYFTAGSRRRFACAYLIARPFEPPASAGGVYGATRDSPPARATTTSSRWWLALPPPAYAGGSWFSREFTTSLRWWLKEYSTNTSPPAHAGGSRRHYSGSPGTERSRSRNRTIKPVTSCSGRSIGK